MEFDTAFNLFNKCKGCLVNKNLAYVYCTEFGKTKIKSIEISGTNPAGNFFEYHFDDNAKFQLTENGILITDMRQNQVTVQLLMPAVIFN
jgi:hypothetical protein